MSWVLFVIASLAALLLLTIGLPYIYIRKSNYAKAVYRELETLPYAKFTRQVRNSPNEELRMQAALLQIQVLKQCYARGVSPKGAAVAITGAMNEFFSDDQVRPKTIVDMP